MKQINPGIALVSLALLIGCGRLQEPRELPFPEGKFHMEVNELISDSSVLVYLIKVQTRGEKLLTWGPKDNPSYIHTSTGVVGSFRDTTSLAESEIILTTTLLKPNEMGPFFHVLLQSRSGSFSGGGTELYTLREDKDLDDLVAINLKSGDYDENETYQLGRLQDDLLTLSVKPIPPTETASAPPAGN